MGQILFAIQNIKKVDMYVCEKSDQFFSLEQLLLKKRAFWIETQVG